MLRTSAATDDLQGTMISSRTALGGCLIINADDWGRDPRTTDRTVECFQRGGLSSASGMVFMQDSERAASIAKEKGLDIGLHLNLSTPFSALGISRRLATHHQKVREYLCAFRFARLLYHPGLTNSVEYVVVHQLEEFARLYRREPDRIDGHHHMHLSANILLQRLLPARTIVRRHFSYEPGEKIVRNLVFRLFSRTLLGGRYRLTDFFFSLPPFAPTRMQWIFNLARRFVVEVEAHPNNLEEYRFLTTGELLHWTTGCSPALAFGKAVALARVQNSLGTL